MPVKHKKADNLKIFSSQLFLTALGLFLIIMISFPLYRHVRQRKTIDTEIARLKSEVKSMEGKNILLKDTINYLKSDQFSEEQARLKLGLKKQGEEVFIVKKNGEEKKPSDMQAGMADYGQTGMSGRETGSNPRLWFEYFFH
jgi:cell division protein FtsB